MKSILGKRMNASLRGTERGNPEGCEVLSQAALPPLEGNHGYKTHISWITQGQSGEKFMVEKGEPRATQQAVGTAGQHLPTAVTGD